MAIGAMLLFRLSVINRAISDFRLDEAVERARINRGEKPTIDDFLNPPYLRRYGLDLNLYMDKQGHFSPTGSDWQRWGLRIKAAATVMWLGHDPGFRAMAQVPGPAQMAWRRGCIAAGHSARERRCAGKIRLVVATCGC